MLLIGMLWAALAPLILLAGAWLLRKTLLAGVGSARAWAAAAVLVALPVALAWWLDWREFLAVCDGEGAPHIVTKASADLIFLDSTTANSFGMRYLLEEGFSVVEAPSIYRRASFVRYEREGASGVRSTEIDALTARYEVKEVFSQPHGHTSLSRTEVRDRATGQLIASAGSANFDGGTARWVLGAWGARSCPSAMNDPASFNDYYHLARNALR
jgi:hypothetical protein